MIDIINQLPKHPKYRYRARKESKITHIVVHHSASRKGNPEQFARWHIKKGWPGIGYHYVIMRNGIVYKCNPVLRTTYHARGANSFSIGICLVGNFNEQKPSGKQLLALKKLIVTLRDALFYMDRKIYNHLKVVGHCDITATSCPGKHLYEWLKQAYPDVV